MDVIRVEWELQRCCALQLPLRSFPSPCDAHRPATDALRKSIIECFRKRPRYSNESKRRNSRRFAGAQRIRACQQAAGKDGVQSKVANSNQRHCVVTGWEGRVPEPDSGSRAEHKT